MRISTSLQLAAVCGAGVVGGSLCQAQPAAPAGTVFYVAVDGRDGWSGGLPAPDQARGDGPFATLARARDAIRALKAHGPLAAPVTVLLRGGLYCLSEPFQLGPEDSGTATAPVTYASYPGEQAWLSAGRVIRGWRESAGTTPRRWEATLDEVAAGRWRFRQLFVQRQGEAYYTRRFRPCRGMLTVADLTWSPARKSLPHRAAQQDFVFFAGDIEPWENLDEVEVVALHSWSASRLRLESIDLDARTVRFTAVPTFRIGSWYKDERNPYYIENIGEDLREPGQWYLDPPSGLLTYLPLPGETLENVALVAPRLEHVVEVRGAVQGPELVEHLVFRGLALAHSEWPMQASGYDTSQGQPQLPAAVEVTYGRQVRFERCFVTNTGAYGISLGLGCQECAVTGCLLADLGGGGVKVGDHTMKRTAEAPILPTGNTVANNTITDTGLVHYSANGIWCGVVRDTRIRHNEVRRNPYSGIAVGWCWDSQPSSCGGNLIERNHVHHVMQLVQDGGGIYTLGRQPGTVIRGNLVHDNLPSPFACSPGQCGLYFDEGSSGFLVEDNVQYRVAWKPDQLVQNQNQPADHDLRTNYLGIAPADPRFPRELAAQAGVEPGQTWDLAESLRLTPNPVYAMAWPTPPPRPVSFALDFEDIPVGRCPRGFSVAGASDAATIGVTAETARSGRRCLEFRDQKGLAKPFYPYIHRTGMRVAAGPVEFSFELRQDPAQPARLWVELRDYDTGGQGEYFGGPSVGILANGVVKVGQAEVAVIPPGAWAHLALRFTLGPKQPTQWQLEVRLADGVLKTHTAPFLHARFALLTALYLCADGDAQGRAYVDDLTLEVKE